MVYCGLKPEALVGQAMTAWAPEREMASEGAAKLKAAVLADPLAVTECASAPPSVQEYH